ncbi:CoA pyrophosphatase [Micrococcales bacterium 31B]|nr:CoA pyrophosphatase [Micrococcales bacterium 31B]
MATQLHPLSDAWTARLRARLDSFARQEASPDRGGASLRRASVALCVGTVGGRESVVLMKRVGRGLNPGQFALPGGKRDPGESAQHTALRELEEEVGVRVTPAEVLGRLDDYVTASGFLMQPFVIAPSTAQRLVRSADEVHSVHMIAVEALTAPGTHRIAQTAEGPVEQWKLRSNLVIHAPTGAILHQFGMLANRGEVVRVGSFAQPAFTHT